MNHSMFRSIGKTMIKSIALFVAFGLLSFISRLIFNGNLFDEEMLSPQAVGGWHFAFLLFIFQSTVFAVNRYAAEPRRVFLETYAHGQRFGKVKSVFRTAELYIEFACVVLLSLVMPVSFLYDCVGVTLFGENYGKWPVLLVLLPILLVLEVLAHLSVRSAWVSDSMPSGSQKESNDFARTIKGVGMTVLVYGTASLVIPWILPFVVTIANLGVGAMAFVYLALVLLAAGLAVIAVFYVRAIRKRRAFVDQLKTYCRENSVTLSDIRKPCVSVFFQHEGMDFSVKVGDSVCACKLVAGILPGSPMVFTDRGEGLRQDTLRLFRVTVLHLNTVIDYRMEDRPEGSKQLVIALPVPKKLYVSVEGSAPRPADTGESMGDYTLYTATGFLHALERGLLK